MLDTKSSDYKKRLVDLQTPVWKSLLNVQAPYRWNIQRIAKGSTLEIGCGIGRNLQHLNGKATGIDHNSDCVAEARTYNLSAFTPDEFYKKPKMLFDNLLFSHILEHLTTNQAEQLLLEYEPFLKPEGKIIVITPQEAGQNSDPTHITFMDFCTLSKLAYNTGFHVDRSYSFPFPRIIGKVFLYNEFISIWKRH